MGMLIFPERHDRRCDRPPRPSRRHLRDERGKLQAPCGPRARDIETRHSQRHPKRTTEKGHLSLSQIGPGVSSSLDPETTHGHAQNSAVDTSPTMSLTIHQRGRATHVDTGAHTFRVRHTRGTVSSELPVTTQLAAILDSRRAESGHPESAQHGWVFPSPTSASGHLKEIKHLYGRISKPAARSSGSRGCGIATLPWRRWTCCCRPR